MLSRFDFKSNGIGFLRLFFAAVVVYAHAYPVGGFGDELFNRVSGHSQTLGQLAVGGFFVLSGFLITRSYERTENLFRFLWHRALRIFPAFWVCLALTALLFGPIALMRGHGAWWPSAGWYVASNALLKTGQTTIAHLFASAPYPLVFNGSIWTLQYEFLCYIALAAVGAIGLLRSRVIVPTLAVAGFLLFQLIAATIGNRDDNALLQLVGMVTYFGFGASAYLLRDSIPMKGWIATGVAIVFVTSTPLWIRSWTFIPCVACLTLYAATVLPIRSFDRRVDLSYGLYIYAFPIQQLLTLYGWNAVGVAGYTMLAMVLALACAACSWFAVERPALSLKSLRVPSPFIRARRASGVVSSDSVQG